MVGTVVRTLSFDNVAETAPLTSRAACGWLERKDIVLAQYDTPNRSIMGIIALFRPQYESLSSLKTYKRTHEPTLAYTHTRAHSHTYVLAPIGMHADAYALAHARDMNLPRICHEHSHTRADRRARARGKWPYPLCVRSDALEKVRRN